MNEFFQIENKAAKLRLSEVVEKYVMDDLIQQIGKVFGAKAAETGSYTGELTACYENAADTLDIEIHSPGGSVMDGYRLYNELLSLRQRGVYVTAHINTMAASMASVIAMAADKITMTKNGQMMIHDVSQAIRGNAEELTKAAELVDEMSDELAEIYANRTGNDKDDVRAMMKKETWMNAKQALDKKFIDEIIDYSELDKIKQSTNVTHMKLLDRLTNPSNEESVERISALEAVITDKDSEIQSISAKLETAENALAEAAEIQAANIELAAKVESIPSFEAKITELAAEIETLKASAEVTAEKIDTAAAQKLAAMGHGEPLDLGNSAPTAVTETILDKFNNLKGAEATAFYKANRKAILSAQSKLSN